MLTLPAEETFLEELLFFDDELLFFDDELLFFTGAEELLVFVGPEELVLLAVTTSLLDVDMMILIAGVECRGRLLSYF